MRDFLEFLGNPLSNLPVIHVAGTNGKGSVVRILSSILNEAGYRVGEFTSPHLQHVNERIRVGNEAISDEELDRLLVWIDQKRREWSGQYHGDPLLTYFEMMTAAAVVFMSSSDVDVAIVEVGLGGRLDATNLVDPLVSVIVSLGLDHMEQLGPNIASIASEKAGIIKKGRPVVVGPLSPDGMRVVRLVGLEHECSMMISGEDFRTLRSEGGRFTWTSGSETIRDLPLKLKGQHQVENAGVALATLQCVKDRFDIDERAIRAGLASVEHPGRIEWLSDDVLVDCAHNSEGAGSLCAYLNGLPRDRKRTLLFGASSGKDIRGIVVRLLPEIDRIMTTQCRHPRSLGPGEVAEQLVGLDVPILPSGMIEEALPIARADDAMVIAAGSIFLVGAVRSLFSEETGGR